uniref:Uncharacterized protein n=1 Tax=Ditylenchus dipsaci TaxID=166011 RepID=A0A915DD35_9BILA
MPHKIFLANLVSLSASYLLIYGVQTIYEYSRNHQHYPSTDGQPPNPLLNQPSHLRPEFQKEYFVVLSSPNTLSQLFLLPLVVLGWQNIGAHSLVFFAGTSAQFEQSRVSQYIVDFLNDLGARTSFVSSNSLPPEVLAGLVRLFAVGMPRTFKFDDNSTVLVTADADMLPLSIDEHTLQQPEEHLKVYGGRTRTRYALNTLTMTTAHWRQLMGIDKYGIDNGDAIYRYLAKEFGKKAMTELINDPDKKLDEILAGRKIQNWVEKYGETVTFANKKINQITRSEWQESNFDGYKISALDDIELPEGLHNPQMWKKALVLLRQIFDDNIIKLLNDYQQEVNNLLHQKDEE